MSTPILFTMTSRGTVYEQMYRDHAGRHAQYCLLHGFGLVHRYFSEPHDLWEKMYALREIVSGNDPPSFIAWLDSDAIISDLDTDLRDCLPPSFGMGAAIHACPLYGSNWHWNMGAFYIRPCAWTAQFIDRIIARKECENEEEALNRILWEQPDPMFATLDTRWSARVQAREDQGAIVVGWHGHKAPEARRAAMLEYTKEKGWS